MLTHLALFRQRALVIALVAFVITLVLWNVPQLDFILYPVRLFVTFVHETGHGLAALISGGRFVNFTVSPDGSGVALTAGDEGQCARVRLEGGRIVCGDPVAQRQVEILL